MPAQFDVFLPDRQIITAQVIAEVLLQVLGILDRIHQLQRSALAALLRDIEANLQESAANESSDSLVDGVNLAIERFDVSHPTVTATLRSILQSLANMGI